MATVRVIYTFEDAKGKRSNTTVRFNVAVDMQNIVTAVQAVANIIRGFAGGRLIGASACIDVELVPDVTILPEADAEEKADFGFVSDSNHVTAALVPTLDEALVSEDSDQLDTDNAFVADFIDFMVNGVNVGGELIRGVDNRGVILAGLRYARETFRASGRRR